MAQLYTKIKLYLEANSKTWDDTKVSLQDNSDGNGAFIASWSYDIAQPTAEQLSSYETEATKIENNNVIISTRKQSYGKWETQLEEIYDNGIDSWKARITQIKTNNPKN
tara:strand:- start:15 stop:341 length:327 start_codon:yes stop_codon:yes gene_type:complete